MTRIRYIGDGNFYEERPFVFLVCGEEKDVPELTVKMKDAIKAKELVEVVGSAEVEADKVTEPAPEPEPTPEREHPADRKRRGRHGRDHE